jgi:TolB-like protein/Tfp pilus assembly protein PilF
MGAIIPGFEYDIFISYRHNDNRSGWVSDFVERLKEELATRIKEPLSIYFDKNSEDGLLETHVVDKSLEGKLKCLIFIPIISQTYCDEKSFAWQHEFRAYNILCASDQLGRDVRLSTGNFASRVLPVRIHDLEADDLSAIEKLIGRPLRAIDFVYKEPGMSRPLKAQDLKADNLNKTDYQNQLTKVANAVKEIISAIKSSNNVLPKQLDVPAKPVIQRPGRAKLVFTAIVVAILTGGLLLYNIIKPHVTMESDKSVAVLAFADMSPGKDQEWFSDGLSEEILNSLAHLPELKVTARTSSFYYKGKDMPLKEIASNLGVAHIVEGSVRKSGQQLRITAQLIRVQDGFHVWSETYDRSADDVFRVQTEIAENIARMLLNELSPDTRSRLTSLKSQNVEAYEYYLRGCRIHLQKYYVTMEEQDFLQAERFFLKSISLDPHNADAYGALADLYDTRSNIPDNYEMYWLKRDSLTKIGLSLDPKVAQVNVVNGWSFLKRRTPNLDSAYFYFARALRLYPNTDFVIGGMAGFYGAVGISDLEERYLQHALELDPLHVTFLNQRALANVNLGLYDNARKDFEKGIEVDHTNGIAHFYLGAMSATEGNKQQVSKRIEAMQAISMSRPWQSIKILQGFLLAMEGQKHKALAPASEDLRLLSILKMKDEFLSVLDSRASFPVNRYDPAGLKQDPQYDFVRDDPRFKAILSKIQEKHDRMMAAYPPPGLTTLWHQ